MLAALCTEKPTTVPKVAGIGVDEVMLAVPLQVPETEKSVEPGSGTDGAILLLSGNDRLELTGPVPPPPPPPPQELSAIAAKQPTNASLICRAGNLLAYARKFGIIETLNPFISPPEQIFGNAFVFPWPLRHAIFLRVHFVCRTSGADYSTEGY